MERPPAILETLSRDTLADVHQSFVKLFRQSDLSFSPLIWQAEVDTELTLSASTATAVGESRVNPGKSRFRTRYLIGRFHSG